MHFQFARPNFAYSLKFLLDAAAGENESFADFFIREAVELELGDLAKAIIVERRQRRTLSATSSSSLIRRGVEPSRCRANSTNS